jgi:hypothetical protein
MKLTLRSTGALLLTSLTSVSVGTLDVAAAPPSTVAAGVVCQVVTNSDVVHIAAFNKGTAPVAAGATFAFTIIGPTKKTNETITFKQDLAPGKSVVITNAIKAKNVVSCSPTA